MFESYFNSARLSDVRFAVGEARAVVCAHRVVLSAASAVFRALLDPEPGTFACDDDDDAPLEVPQCTPDAFLAVVRHAYGLGADLRADNVADVARAADYYAMRGLVRECSTALTDRLLDADNVVDTLLALPDEHWAAPLRQAALLYAVRCPTEPRGLERVPHEDVSDALLQHDACSSHDVPRLVALVCMRIDAGSASPPVVDRWRQQLSEYVASAVQNRYWPNDVREIVGSPSLHAAEAVALYAALFKVVMETLREKGARFGPCGVDCSSSSGAAGGNGQ